MSINFGATPIVGAYLGSVQAEKVMLGTTEIWSASVYPLSDTWVGVLTATSVQATPPIFHTHTMRKSGLFRVVSHLSATETQFPFLRIVGPWGVTFGNPQTSLSVSAMSVRVLKNGDTLDFRAGAVSPNGTTTCVWLVEELPMPKIASTEPDYWFPLSYSDDPHGSRGTVAGGALSFDLGTFADRGNHAWVSTSRSRVQLSQPWGGIWSMSGWFQRSGTASSPGETLFSRGSSAVGRGIRLYAEPNGTDLRLVVHSGTSTSTSSLIPNVLSLNTWRHIAITSHLSGGRPVIRVFVNGVGVHETLVSNNFSFTTADWVSFGNYSDSSNNSPFNGNVDDLALWSKTLTADEVLQIFQEGRVQI